MPYPAFLRKTVCIMSTVALLAAVISSPIRPLRMGKPSCAIYLSRHFATPPLRSAVPQTFSAASGPVLVKALITETDKELHCGQLTSGHIVTPASSLSISCKPAVQYDLSTSHPLRC